MTPAQVQQFWLPAVWVGSGQLTTSLDSNADLTSLSLNGHVKVNVCAALS
jgi:hypothetical protein